MPLQAGTLEAMLCKGESRRAEAGLRAEPLQRALSVHGLPLLSGVTSGRSFREAAAYLPKPHLAVPAVSLWGVSPTCSLLPSAWFWGHPRGDMVGTFAAPLVW